MQSISLDTNRTHTETPILEEQLASFAVHRFTSLKRDEPITRRSTIGLRRSGRITAAVLALVSAAAVLGVGACEHRCAVAVCGKAKSDIIAIDCALKDYAKQHAGAYPERLELLTIPDANGRTYFESGKLPRDPWHNDYLYDRPSAGRAEPRVYSLGKDGKPGGDGDDADVDNSLLRQEPH
jgi:general secretion pathway protein G